jgi:hypothetical protein
MGHGEKIHALYATDDRLPAKIDFHTFYQTMRASGIWHELVGFKSNLLRDLNHGNKKLPVVFVRNNHEDDFANVMLHLPSVSVASIADAVKGALSLRLWTLSVTLEQTILQPYLTLWGSMSKVPYLGLIRSLWLTFCIHLDFETCSDF